MKKTPGGKAEKQAGKRLTQAKTGPKPMTSSAQSKKKTGQTVRQGKKAEELRILILEDNAVDAELMERQLRREQVAFSAQRAAERAGFSKALDEFRPDVILADYSLPKFNALNALKLAREKIPFVPFIIVTGSIGEEEAVACLRAGADDYLLKDRLSRLGEAVLNAQEKRRLQNEKTDAAGVIQAAAARWAATFDSMNDLVCLLDERGAILQCNRALKEALGRAGEAIAGKSCRQLLCGAEPEAHCSFQELLLTRERQQEVKSWRGRWYKVTVDPVLTKNKRISGAVHVMADITAARELEEKQHESEERFRVLTERSPYGVALIDASGRWLYVNSRFSEMTGFRREEIPDGRTWFARAFPDETLRRHASGEWLQDLGRIRSGESIKRQHPVRTKDGRERYMDITSTHLGRDQVILVFEDVTEKREFGEALRASEARYRLISENSGDVVWTVGLPALRFTYVSPSVLRLRGLTPEEVMAQPLAASMTGESYRALFGKLPGRLAAFAAGDESARVWTSEIDMIHKDGSIVPTEVVTTLLGDDRSRVTQVLGATRDISERKRAEQALREMSEIFRLFLKHNPIYVFIKDEEIRPIYLSENYERMLGRPVAELLGRTMDELFPSELSRRMIADDQRLLREGRPIEVVEYLNGRTYSTLKFPIVIDGQAKYLAGYTTDITERQRADEQIRASLREKEILLKEIHHRVKNNLQVVSGLLTLQMDKIGDEHLKQVLRDSQSRIWTMSLIHQLLYESGNLAEIEMADYIRNLTGTLLSTYTQENALPTLSFDLSPVRLAIDKAIPLALIVNELVTNAIKHAFTAAPPGTIRISLHCSPAQDDSTCDLVIADDGAGLPEGFDPAMAKSLGLQLVAMLSKQLGGTLAMERNGGAVFRVTFPKHD